MAEPAVAVRAEESAVFARGVSRPWMMIAAVICIGPRMAAIAAALHNVYLVTGVLALVGLAVTWALPRGLSPTNAARDRRDGGWGNFRVSEA